MPEQLALARERHLPNARFVEGSADNLSAFPDGSFDAVLDCCILHHVEGWRTFFDECHRVLRNGRCIYMADLSRFEELEREANSRGFRTIKKATDLGLEGYYRFQKE